MSATLPRHMLRSSDKGQMTVELAVLVPVVVVVALTVVNLGRYVELCAQFDRVAPDMVIAHGVAPSGEVSLVSSVASAQAAIEEAMGDSHGLGGFEVRVDARGITGEAAPTGGIVFPVSPLLAEFVCTLTYRPWPESFVIAGLAYRSPVALSHTRSVIVDRFRPGVVV